jgi:UDP-N-acetylmuramate--alanine ligase
MLVREWASAFADADCVLIGDIYASREQPISGIDAAWLVAHINHPMVTASGDPTQTVTYLQSLVQSGDVVITLSAGDGTTVGPALLVARGATV